MPALQTSRVLLRRASARAPPLTRLSSSRALFASPYNVSRLVLDLDAADARNADIRRIEDSGVVRRGGAVAKSTAAAPPQDPRPATATAPDAGSEAAAASQTQTAEARADSAPRTGGER